MIQVPVADGGDGTVAAAASAGFTLVSIRADGPTGEPVDTALAMRDGVAVVELADVSDLRLLPPDRLAPLHASSYGTGQVISRRRSRRAGSPPGTSRSSRSTSAVGGCPTSPRAGTTPAASQTT